MTATSTATVGRYGKATLSILVLISCSHMLNDIMQSLLASLYPIFKVNYALTFAQIGLLTLTFQVTASLLQPLVGMATDRWPMPYSLPVGMTSTFFGLILLGNANSYGVLLIGASLIGVGSSIFHPEASRVARLASGGRHGFAQSMFQVGGNFGSAVGPLLAAFIVLPIGQHAVAWLSILAMIGVVALTRVGHWYATHQRQTKGQAAPSRALPFTRNKMLLAMSVLVLLTATKNIYMASISSYFTFYVIERFAMTTQQAQLMLFLFLGAAAVGTFIGGPIGDRYGPRFVIWLSILGVIPFAMLLPYADLFWTGVLSVVIGLVFASAFPAIMVFAMQIVPGRVGMIGGLLFGFAFGTGGLGAAALGLLADDHGIEYVYWLCSFLPLLGLFTVLLPRVPEPGSLR